MNAIKQVTRKERVHKALSFTIAAMNATNVLMPVAIPYVKMATAVQQDFAQSNIAQISVEGVHLGAQMLDRLIFNKAEAFTSPVENGEVVYEEIVSAGWQTILSGGTAIRGYINYGGLQIISSGGLAIDTTINNNGYQVVVNGGIANSTTINSDGDQLVSNGGTANSTTINNAGYQRVDNGGIANSTTINSSGYQLVSNGGIANSTTINSGGHQVVVNGGIANSITINSGGHQFVVNGGTSLAINQKAGANVNTDVAAGATTRITGTNESGAFSLANGTAANFILYSGGYQRVSNGGVVSSTTINSGGYQWVINGGIASSTTINSGGYQLIDTGGTSLAINQKAGANVNTDVAAGATTRITGTNESGAFSLANGTATNFILYRGGYQLVGNGGIASSTTINSGGIQEVFKGGTSLAINQKTGANVNTDVAAGATTRITGTNESGAFSLANGTATNFILYSGGSQLVDTGGIASSTTINSGGYQLIDTGGTSLAINQKAGANVFTDVTAGATTRITGTNESGAFSLANGTASNFILYSGGQQLVDNGGTSLAINQKVGGNVNTDVAAGATTRITGTNESGAFSLANGTATNFILYSGGYQLVGNGGIAGSTTINSEGYQLLANGGIASSTTINSGGHQQVANGGIAGSTIINSGGSQVVDNGGTSLSINQKTGANVFADVAAGATTRITGTNESGAFSLANGTATNFILYSGGSQLIDNGGTAGSTTINSGGSQLVVNGGTTFDTNINGGYQWVDNGGHAVATKINSGGSQNLDWGGVATSTIVSSSAQQNIHQMGNAISTTINNGGSVFVHDGGSATDTVVNSGGIMYGHSNGALLATTIKDGGTLLLFRSAVVDGVSNSGYIDASKFGNGGSIGAISGNGGVVLFNSDPYTPVIYNQTLNLGSLAGSQTFDISVDLKNNKADNLVITGDVSGTHYIKVSKEASPGSSLSSLKGPATVATVLGIDTSKFLGIQSSIDGVKITPNIIHNGNLWQIDSYAVTGTSDLSKVAAAGAAMNYAALYNNDNILKLRMGELKDNLKDSGLWVKLSGGETAIDGNNFKHTTFQGGYDKVRKGKNGTSITGIMFERLNGSTTYTDNGSGKLKNTRVGLYHAWFGNSGQYYDIAFKTGSLRNEITVNESTAIKGKSSAWNTALSLEYGYKKQLKAGMYITPFAKLSLGRINGVNYTTDSDTAISQNAINSIQGKLGIGIGQSSELSKWYFNTVLVHEFTAKSKVTTGQGDFASTIENSIKGTAVELSLGTSVQVSKAGLLYADVSKSFGGKVVNKWQLQAGFRFNF